MKRRAVKHIFLTLFLVMAVSCSDKPPEEVMREEQYESIFMELAILNQTDTNFIDDEERSELRNEIYSKYNTDEERFRITHEYYESRIPEQLERMERISLNLRAERDSISAVQKRYREANKENPDSLRQRLLNR
jgi:hypothetical protein